MKKESNIIFPNMDKLLFAHHVLNSSFCHSTSPTPHIHTLLYSANGSIFIFLWIYSCAHYYFFGLFVYPCFNTTMSYIHRSINLTICQGKPSSLPPHTHHLFLFLKSILTIRGPLLSHVNFRNRLLRSMINF